LQKTRHKRKKKVERSGKNPSLIRKQKKLHDVSREKKRDDLKTPQGDKPLLHSAKKEKPSDSVQVKRS